MPIVNCDVKNLEGFTAAELSDDKVMKTELRDKLDMHAANQEAFALPDRVTAKRFLFKLLYGATAYGYSTDADFLDVGYSEKQWQKVIDNFYTKYSGIAKWHAQLLQTVQRTGMLESISGRFYTFTPKQGRNGLKWPATQIKNYLVQGTAGDLVKLARIDAWKRVREAGLKSLFIQTIHDSLVYDCPEEEAFYVATILKESVEAIPTLCREKFGYNWSLPMFCECHIGPNKKELEEIYFS